MRHEDVYRLQRQMKKFYRRVQREQPAIEGMSSTSLHILATLDRSAHPMRPGELAVELDMASSNVAAALRTLEAQHLVERREDPADGRKAFIELTEHGRQTVADIRRSRHAWLQHAINHTLSEKEQRVLLDAGELMERLAQA